MNVNFQPQMPAIKDWLINSSHLLLGVGIPSAKLDAELILSIAVKKDRTYLHAHPDQELLDEQIEIANLNLKKRLERLPIAYILGYKEFYGRNFLVSPDVLIPRPESETIIEILIQAVKELFKNNPLSLIDVGTGSGCLGISAKLEIPEIHVTLSDISTDALEIAKKNANNLKANVEFINGNLLDKLDEKIDIIIANLPYVDQSWERSPETNFEPPLALFADRDGVALIENLIIQTEHKLNKNGLLIIEADPIQHNQLISFASNYNLHLYKKDGFIISFLKN